MSKKLIVYYSLSGNTKYVAEVLKEKLGSNCDIIALKPKKDLNPDGASKFVWGGYAAKMKQKPELENNLDELNLGDYNEIYLGSPVWAWTVSPPIRSFISKVDLKGKKLGIWMNCAGNGEKAMQRYKKSLDGSEIVKELLISDPELKNKSLLDSKIEKWIK